MVRLVRRRRDPEMIPYNEPFERIVNEMLRPMSLWQQEAQGAWSVPIDVYEENDEVVVKANVAGIDPEKLHVEMDEESYRIWGEMGSEDEIERETYHLRERRLGRFERSGTLPFRIDQERVTAEVNRGVLIVRAPKSNEGRAREIKVNVKE